MSTSKLSIVAAMGVLIGMSACSDMPVSPSDDVSVLSSANEAASLSKQDKAFVEIPFGPDTFPFVNPCTGLPDEVTITGTLWIYDRGDGRFVVRAKDVVTTESGFEGRRTRTFLNNGNNFKLSINSMGTNAIGQRIRVHFVEVVDLPDNPEEELTVRVRTEGGPVCVHQ